VDGAQGALSRPERFRGCDHTQCRCRATSANRISSRGSYACPGAARLKWADRQCRIRPALQDRSNMRLKRPRSNPDKANAPWAADLSVSQDGSYEVPVLEWRRPGGSGLAKTDQGLQAYLSLPPRCPGVSRERWDVGPWGGMGAVRQNEVTRERTKVRESAASPRSTKGARR